MSFIRKKKKFGSGRSKNLNSIDWLIIQIIGSKIFIFFYTQFYTRLLHPEKSKNK